jgi:hypothetical protein
MGQISRNLRIDGYGTKKINILLRKTNNLLSVLNTLVHHQVHEKEM